MKNILIHSSRQLFDLQLNFKMYQRLLTQQAHLRIFKPKYQNQITKVVKKCYVYYLWGISYQAG